MDDNGILRSAAKRLATASFFSKRMNSVAVFIIFLVVWLLSRFPAFVHPVFLADDFSMWDFTFSRLFEGGASQGRLLNGIWYSLYFLIPPPDHQGATIFRLIQGGLHVFAGFLVWGLIARHIGSMGAFLAVLLFLFWGFNSEATIWLAGSTYPLAAFLSVAGVGLILQGFEAQKPRLGFLVLGVSCVLMSVHSNQSPALLGLSVWVTRFGLKVMDENQAIFDRVSLHSAFLIFASYFLGAVSSLFSIHHFEGNRLEGSTTLVERASKLVSMLEQLWFFPGVYSGFYIAGYVVLVGLFLAGTMVNWGRLPKRRILLVIAVVCMLSVLPYLPVLMATGNPTPPRVFYAGTIVWVSLFAFAWKFYERHRLIQFGLLLLSAYLFAWNLNYSITESNDYAEITRRDREALAALEDFADQYGAKEVLFMDWWHSNPWAANPYDLNLSYKPSVKHSIFQYDYGAYRYLSYYSQNLENTPWWPMSEEGQSRWDRLRDKYESKARSLPHDEWIKFIYAEEESLIIVVPR